MAIINIRCDISLAELAKLSTSMGLPVDDTYHDMAHNFSVPVAALLKNHNVYGFLSVEVLSELGVFSDE